MPFWRSITTSAVFDLSMNVFFIIVESCSNIGVDSVVTIQSIRMRFPPAHGATIAFLPTTGVQKRGGQLQRVGLVRYRSGADDLDLEPVDTGSNTSDVQFGAGIRFPRGRDFRKSPTDGMPLQYPTRLTDSTS
jgi:hypothetical protein